MSVRVAVFASGGGSNLQALIDHFADRPVARIALVITDRDDTGAEQRARSAGIAAHVIPVRGRPSAAVAADTVDALEGAGTDLVALAGYLRLLPGDVVRRMGFRILNIHPALLPSFGGKGMYGRNVHRAVLESGCRITGPTVHFVNERYDQGRILAQWPVPVLDGDTPESLAGRVLRVEHALYPRAVEWLARVLSSAAGQEADAAAAVQEALPLPVRDDIGFYLDQGGEPDHAGIRRLFALEQI